MSHKHDLHAFMAQVTNDMTSEYERIYARAAEDPGTAGDAGEENWAVLFREWLPSNYHIETKGRLISHNGELSPQIDVIILKPSYPTKLLTKKIWLAGGVAAAFECKTTLTSAHVNENVRRAEIFKSLALEKSGTPYSELCSPIFYGLLSHSHSWKGNASQPILNIQNAYDKAAQEINSPKSLIDVICVADLATWSQSKLSQFRAEWVENTDIKKEISGEWGILTSMMCAQPKSEMQSNEFTPIGALIASITEHLANEDLGVRALAYYYRAVGLTGESQGISRFWPASVYSQVVREKINQGLIVDSRNWSEWRRLIS